MIFNGRWARYAIGRSEVIHGPMCGKVKCNYLFARSGLRGWGRSGGGFGNYHATVDRRCLGHPKRTFTKSIRERWKEIESVL